MRAAFKKPSKSLSSCRTGRLLAATCKQAYACTLDRLELAAWRCLKQWKSTGSVLSLQCQIRCHCGCQDGCLLPQFAAGFITLRQGRNFARAPPVAVESMPPTSACRVLVSSSLVAVCHFLLSRPLSIWKLAPLFSLSGCIQDCRPCSATLAAYEIDAPAQPLWLLCVTVP